MLLTPLDRPFDWKNPPRLTLGICLLLLVIFIPWHAADLRLERELAEEYRGKLLDIEWPLYETHALKTGQRARLQSLKAEFEAAREDPERLDKVALYVAMDDGFVQAMKDNGKDYLSPDLYARWEMARAEFDPKRSRLSGRALGVDPQQEDIRLITLLTFGLVQADTMQLLAGLMLLLTMGLCLELQMGSGALLASLLGGSATGALVFLVLVGGDVVPLTGASVGAAALTGMFLMHYKAGRVRALNRVEIPAYSLALLWLLLVAAEFVLSGLRVSELAARLAALASGPLWAYAYGRWFVHATDYMPVITSDVQEDEREVAYRQQLNSALEAVARLDFAQAQKLLRELIKQNPSDLRVLTQLYNVEKLTPEGPGYEAVARRMFNYSAAENDQLVLKTYRDYLRHSRSQAALDLETSIKLVARLTRMNEVIEADKLMRQVLEKRQAHPLIQKTALALADALERLREPGRARFLRQAVGQG
ncbi:MAG TPA: rhomboid family intramembrane serine protease [Moraxellaceae bacterium]|nr:rhomboid family intramembrane serine protease [Moraxellaceae bacterium]